MSTSPHPAYAGDVSVSEAWDLLKGGDRVRLVDVRTAAEWNFVGLPDLSGLGQEVQLVEWQSFPSGSQNPRFAAEVAAAVGADTNITLLFICRSGARSRSAAIAMTAAGYAKSFNVTGGFEGDLDGERHRGRIIGWKAAGLPWIQT